MSQEDYKKARKSAQKDYRTRILKGEYPYLQVLDDIVSFTDVAAERDLGLVEIPLDQVIGTKTAGRTRAFAGNFMPLLPEDSEFAVKWSHLLDSHMEEGIREPVIACEFMNRFYIAEGNKRVSVLKYVGAYSISGYVTRIIPKRNDDPENRIYYEFLDFYEQTSINYLWFSREGSFERLTALTGKLKGERWSREERLCCRSAYVHFTDVYKEMGGQQLPITAGDAFLIYLNIYGYGSLRDKSREELRQELSNVWKDFEEYPMQPAMELVMQPKQKEELPIISRLIAPAAPAAMKIAFLHESMPERSGWTYGHELGRQYLEEAMKGQVQTVAFDNINSEELGLEAIEKAAGEGCSIIFTTSPRLLGAAVKGAVKHPDIKMLNCSLNVYSGHLRTYYGRLYEAKFLIGVLAGILTDNDRIGYLADYPIYGTTANINAFALGVKMINPRARVYLKWSTVKGQDPEQEFRRLGVSFVSGQDLFSVKYGSRQFGLYDIRNGQMKNVASPAWNWGKFYERIVRSILNGIWKREIPSGPRTSVNYWWGISSGMIDVIYSNNIPCKTGQLLEVLKQQILSGSFHPFSGEIRDQEGKLRCEGNDVIEPVQIITMDWLADNVVGSIPDKEELTEDVWPVVELQGIKQTMTVQP
ncbi:MAG: BMP family ABC transporter substrate-binding protein [Lachnospiraceae bacterium]|nr:BMP family ABC transporter substrate-binding protein [Lachnospiraceae bacterium]